MDTAGTEGTGGFRLLRYFSIASLIALVLAVAGLAFLFREIALKQVVKFGEEMNVNLSIAFANALRPDYIPLITAAEKSSPEEIKASAAAAVVHKAVTAAARQTHVVKVAIHDLKGRTIYSSDPRSIGEDKSGDSAFAAARAGGVKTVLVRNQSVNAFGQALGDRDLLSSYVPARLSTAGVPDAVFEISSDVTPYLQEIRRTQVNMRFAVAGIILTLYGVLFFIVKRADDVIKRQERQREKDAETIRHLAHHDPLTDLPNRKLFTDRLSITLARAKRSGRMAALMFVDFDHFKEVNDTLGHGVGDEVLKEAGKRLAALLRASDTVARLGGDEFTIIIDDIADAEHPGGVAEKIRNAFAPPIVTATGREIVVTPSIGIALYPVHAHDVDALLRAADAAMYDAKAAGRNGYRFYRDAASAEAAV